MSTSADTDGAAVVIETAVKPDGFVASAHVHPFQSERFVVSAGTLGLKIRREWLTLEPGDVATVEAGTAHRFWNAGETPMRFVCEIRPALQFESLLETMFALAADGKTGRKGMPSPFRLAVIAKAHFDTVQLPFPPAWAQMAALALGAPIGRLAGYEPFYPAGPIAPASLPLLSSE